MIIEWIPRKRHAWCKITVFSIQRLELPIDLVAQPVIQSEIGPEMRHESCKYSPVSGLVYAG